MRYEEIKTLKDAGFPGSTEWVVVSKNFYDPQVSILSDLIEACGDEFVNLDRYKGYDKDENMKWWCGYGEYYGDGDYEHYVHASTPEEAVAKLWLALKKEKEKKENLTH